MSLAHSHPSREALVACALGEAPSRDLVHRVRRHLELDRCVACSRATYELLRGDAERARRSPLVSRWLRPTRVGARAGTRAGVASDQQLTCAAGPYRLDVVVCEGARELRYAGQVTHAGRASEPAAGLVLRPVGLPLPATLEARTDDLGEFTLAMPRDGVYALRMGEALEAPTVMLSESWGA